MRYLLCIIAVLTSLPAFSADVVRRSVVKGPQIAIRLTVANPCLNSQYADLASCRGKLTQHVVETTQQLPLHTNTGEVVSGTPAASYLIRTTDYY